MKHVLIVEDIAEERGSLAETLRRGNVYKYVRAALEGMENEPARSDDRRPDVGHTYTMMKHLAFLK